MKSIPNKVFSIFLSASMLASLLPASALAAGFSDVPQGAYYQDAVEWAAQNLITSGTGSTTFSPNLHPRTGSYLPLAVCRTAGCDRQQSVCGRCSQLLL